VGGGGGWWGWAGFAFFLTLSVLDAFGPQAGLLARNRGQFRFSARGDFGGSRLPAAGARQRFLSPLPLECRSASAKFEPNRAETRRGLWACRMWAPLARSILHPPNRRASGLVRSNRTASPCAHPRAVYSGPTEAEFVGTTSRRTHSTDGHHEVGLRTGRAQATIPVADSPPIAPAAVLSLTQSVIHG
jgi:hypothetical protein